MSEATYLNRGDQVILERQVWYVRALMVRGLDSSIREINEAKKGLREHPDLAGSIAAGMRNMIAYSEQFVREATEVLEQLPDELQPMWHMMPEQDKDPV